MDPVVTCLADFEALARGALAGCVDWPDTLDLILDAPSLSDAEKEAIVGGNLVALLRIES